MTRTQAKHMAPTQAVLFLSYQRHKVLMHMLYMIGYITLGNRGKHASGKGW